MADLEMFRGDSAFFDLTIKQPDDSPLPLAGCTIRFTAKEDIYAPDSDAVFSVSTLDGSITVVGDPVDGLALVELVPSDTASMYKAARLHYDVQVKKANGNTYTVMTGRLEVKDDVTRAL